MKLSEKSPLRYPGGKTFLVKQIVPYIPKVPELVSPFVGGGTVS